MFSFFTSDPNEYGRQNKKLLFYPCGDKSGHNFEGSKKRVSKLLTVDT